MDKIRTAFFGCGHMHSYSYISGLKELSVEVVGVTDYNLEASEKFAKTFEIPCYENAQAIIDKQNELGQKLDFVVVCSENATHKDYAVLAAKNGIHVIVEKPIATTVPDAEEMIRVCNENKVKLFICYPVRYMPAIIEAKKIIDSGELGSVVSVTGSNHGSMPGGWFIDKKLSGGGSVIDHTVHVTDVMNLFFNLEIKSVYAYMDTLIHPIECEDCGLLTMEFTNGLIASLDTSWNRPKSNPTWGDVIMDINGTEKSIHLDGFSERYFIYSDKATKATFGGFGIDSDTDMLKDFIDAIENDKPSPIPGEAGLLTLKIALMAYESKEKREVVFA